MNIKKLFVWLLFLVLPLCLSGCFWSPVDRQDNQAEPSGEDNSARSLSDKSAPPSVGNEEPLTGVETTKVKKFYPDANQAETDSSQGVEDEEQDFVITQELQVKIHLVDKYNPGVCYGAPAPVPEQAISGTIERNKQLAEFLRARYSLATDLAVYEKIKQLSAIRLEIISGGRYTYYFSDGQCCYIKAYQGEVTVVGQIISDEVIQTESQQNPC